MRRITPVLLLFVMIQLTAAVEIAVAKLFPKEPTKVFDNGNISRIAYSPDGELLAITESRGILLYDPRNTRPSGPSRRRVRGYQSQLPLVPMAHCLPQGAEMPRFDCGTSPPKRRYTLLPHTIWV